MSGHGLGTAGPPQGPVPSELTSRLNSALETILFSESSVKHEEAQIVIYEGFIVASEGQISVHTKLLEKARLEKRRVEREISDAVELANSEHSVTCSDFLISY